MSALIALWSALTLSGAFVVAWSLAVTILFVVRLAARRWDGAGPHVYLMVALWAWVVYLVTP